MKKNEMNLRGQPLDKIQEGYFCYDKAIKYNTLSEYAKHIREQVKKQEKGNGNEKRGEKAFCTDSCENA